MQAVIFDFNGTLFFDTKIHIDVWKQFLWEQKKIVLTDNDFKEKIFGRDNAQIIRNFYPELTTREEIIQVSEAKEAMYRQVCKDNPEITHLVKGATEFFDYLKEHQIPFTIATGANKSNVDFYFEVFGLSRWFDYNQVIYDDGHLPGKPDPTVYRLAIEKLQVNPQDCLVFEDSPAGVKAAKAAGILDVVFIQKESDLDVLAVIQDYTNAQKLLKKQ